MRDGGCAFPGCDVPPAWTDAHHLQHWAAGGKTTLDNAVLLCGFHHGLIHRTNGGWTIHLDPDDRTPWLTPPKWIDPDQQPRRNHLHDLTAATAAIQQKRRQ